MSSTMLRAGSTEVKSSELPQRSLLKTESKSPTSELRTSESESEKDVKMVSFASFHHLRPAVGRMLSSHPAAMCSTAIASAMTLDSKKLTLTVASTSESGSVHTAWLGGLVLATGCLVRKQNPLGAAQAQLARRRNTENTEDTANADTDSNGMKSQVVLLHEVRSSSALPLSYRGDVQANSPIGNDISPRQSQQTKTKLICAIVDHSTLVIPPKRIQTQKEKESKPQLHQIDKDVDSSVSLSTNAPAPGGGNSELGSQEPQTQRESQGSQGSHIQGSHSVHTKIVDDLFRTIVLPSIRAARIYAHQVPGGTETGRNPQSQATGADRDRDREAGSTLMNGVLLLGPPGVGKTYSVHALQQSIQTHPLCSSMANTTVSTTGKTANANVNTSTNGIGIGDGKGKGKENVKLRVVNISLPALLAADDAIQEFDRTLLRATHALAREDEAGIRERKEQTNSGDGDRDRNRNGDGDRGNGMEGGRRESGGMVYRTPRGKTNTNTATGYTSNTDDGGGSTSAGKSTMSAGTSTITDTHTGTHTDTGVGVGVYSGSGSGLPEKDKDKDKDKEKDKKRFSFSPGGGFSSRSNSNSNSSSSTPVHQGRDQTSLSLSASASIEKKRFSFSPGGRSPVPSLVSSSSSAPGSARDTKPIQRNNNNNTISNSSNSNSNNSNNLLDDMQGESEDDNSDECGISEISIGTTTTVTGTGTGSSADNVNVFATRAEEQSEPLLDNPNRTRSTNISVSVTVYLLDEIDALGTAPAQTEEQALLCRHIGAWLDDLNNNSNNNENKNNISQYTKTKAKVGPAKNIRLGAKQSTPLMPTPTQTQTFYSACAVATSNRAEGVDRVFRRGGRYV